jgi:tRNA pseudouridine55 synthase
MDGVLLVDKPSGPTSHDVVARMRRALGERAVGHTGTLDPLASGLLPLVVGRATRLASLLSGRDKAYDAHVTLGTATSTDDAMGVALPEPAGPVPAPDVVIATLRRFCGRLDQMPPRYSAKKVGGARAYDLARGDREVPLTVVPVTVREITNVNVDGAVVSLRVTASAGFYVRALARDLGAVLGCGGHLTALRRVSSGPFGLNAALPLGEAERMPRAELAGHLVSAAAALPDLAECRVSGVALARVLHGNWIGPAHVEERHLAGLGPGGPVKLLADDGRLVALASYRDGALHPVTVLG